MTEELPGQDAALLADLRAAMAEVDRVPPDVVTAAKAAFGWRLVDTFLAELVGDSDLAPLAGVRGAGPSRLLTFEAGPVTVEVDVAVTGDSRRLVGQLVPPSAGEVQVRHRAGSVTARADDLGHFLVEGVPHGPASLLCRLARPGAPAVATSWMTI